jgi:hypothetical protein
MGHVLLLGDSIFDNAVCVRSQPVEINLGRPVGVRREKCQAPGLSSSGITIANLGCLGSKRTSTTSGVVSREGG